MCMKYVTVGTIKTIDLSMQKFTLEPVFSYRFQKNEGDENDWKIICRPEGQDDISKLELLPKDTEFKFDEKLVSAIVFLKQNKTKLEVRFSAEEKGERIYNRKPVEIAIR